MNKYDVIIIGTGQAGPPLAKAMAEDGQSVAIIEKGHLGGSCVNVGCTPTKAYVASARRAYVSRNSRELGISVDGTVRVDMKTIKKRKDEMVRDKRDGLLKMLSSDGIDLLRGHAEFVDDHTISVDGGDPLRGNRIFINVGGRPRIPDNFSDVDFLTNETILDLTDIPDHLLIVGGGYIGLEFAQMFRRFGSRVTIFQRGNQLLDKEDADIGAAIAEVMKGEGVEVVFDAECTGAKNIGSGVEVNYRTDKGTQTVGGSHLLLAVGRIPNTDTLSLDKASVKVDDRGYIPVDDTLKTIVDHIYALGDCNGQGGFTHTAYNDFQIVKSQLLGDKHRSLSDRFTCYAAFIDPALARVGLNKHQIIDAGIPAKVAEMPMKHVARALEKGETAGLMRIYVHAETDRFLGAVFLGAEADEYIHVIIDAMYGELPYQKIRDAVHIHPTVSELIPTMLENLKALDAEG